MQCDMILISKRCFPNHCQEDDVYDGKDFADEKERDARVAAGAAGLRRRHCGGGRGRDGRGAGRPGQRGDGHRHCVHGPGLDPAVRAQGPQAPGGFGADFVRQLHRHPERGGLLLGQPLLHGGQPRRRHPPEPERGRPERRRHRAGRGAGQGGGQSGRGSRQQRQKDLPQADDPEQRPPEDQRLPGQSGGDRHRGDLAGQGHRQGGVQCGQLQGISLPPV